VGSELLSDIGLTMWEREECLSSNASPHMQSEVGRI
jgi:hypothetical protein